MEPQRLTWAKQLQSLSSAGLHFARDPYDEERYNLVGSIANAMIAAIADQPVTRVQPLISVFAQGFMTPKRRACCSNQTGQDPAGPGSERWTLPGGFTDVGLSPRDNVLKEIQEEAGLNAWKKLEKFDLFPFNLLF